jgi:microcystin-dependent protein
MADPFVSEIRIFGGNFAPTGWAECNGQLLPISQNTALFSLLGTFYGGDGKSTFALPNLQGSVPMGQGQGQGLSERVIGEIGGTTDVTLLVTEMPVHTHNVQTYTDDLADVNTPSPAVILGVSQSLNLYSNTAPGATFLNDTAVAPVGSSLPHNNLQPYLVLMFIIALQGVYPPRG